MIQRRAFTTLAMIGVPLPISVSAQPATRIYRVGVLDLSDQSKHARRDFDEFVLELARRGYVDSRNLAFEKRVSGQDVESAKRHAAELVRLNVDVIYSIGGSLSARIAMQATTSIPIVFDASEDAVADGLVSSLAKPGGNVTGMSLQAGDQWAKALQYLSEATGALTSFAVITSKWTRLAPWFSEVKGVLARAASGMGIQMQFLDVESMSDLEPAVQRLVGQGVNGVSLWRTNWAQRGSVIAAMLVKYRLASLGPASLGYLLDFGSPDGVEARAAAKYVDKILRGAKPTELPVEQPTEWYLEINLKTARALGLDIPKSLLLRATRVVG